jgi:hypothetical protein
MESKLAALKQEMGLLPATSGSGEAAKQLSAGDDEEDDEGSVQDAQVEEVSEDEAEDIPEAQLLEEFGRLEERQAEK